MKKIIEVEVKRALDVPADEFRQRLAAGGYRLISEDREVDTYYSRSDVDFMETVECLRIRQKDDVAEITYKPPTVLSKVDILGGVTAKPETNVMLLDTRQAENADQLFSMLDFPTLAVVDKHRESYRQPDNKHVTVTIDTIESAGVFVEVEVMSEDEHSARKSIENIERDLMTDSMPLVTKPYRDIVMENNNG